MAIIVAAMTEDVVDFEARGHLNIFYYQTAGRGQLSLSLKKDERNASETNTKPFFRTLVVIVVASVCRNRISVHRQRMILPAFDL